MPPSSTPMPVIVGPTAGGKSALGVEVALLMGGEIVSADAFQVYRGMDIGTAKSTLEERRGVPHHLIDIRDPVEAFSVDRWLALAAECFQDIRARGRTPVVVGGTLFYVKALLEGLFEGPEVDPLIRAELHALAPQSRRAELERIDPKAAARIHPNDSRRTIRALEVHRATGKPISEHQQQWDRGTPRDDAFLVVLNWPIPEINSRINARVRLMIERGLVDEARALWQRGRLGIQAREALGYKQLIRHFEGGSTLEEAVERIKIDTRRLAKSQRTWLRRLAPWASPAGKISDISAATDSTHRALVISAAGSLPGDSAQTIANTALAMHH